MNRGTISFEKRKNPRVQISLPIHYKRVNPEESPSQMPKKNPGKMDNLSRDGVFLVTDELMVKDDILRIEFVLPKHFRPIKTYAEIIWLSDEGLEPGQHGAGIMFMALRDEDRDRLSDFITQAFKDSING
jgi:hypothetical protein